MNPKAIIRAALVMMPVLAPAGAADVPGIVNAIRSDGCADLPALQQPLRSSATLDEAARRSSDGKTLDIALAQSGYPAKRSASIHVRTTSGETGIARVLRQRFCDIVMDPTLQEIGIFGSGDEVWMVLAQRLAPPPGEDARSAARRVLELINEARQEARRCGRNEFDATRPLRRSAELERAARAHANDMAAHSFLGHEGSDGSMPAGRASRAGYAWISVAENVAAGQTTAEDVVDTWIASAGHCENLMDPRYSESGVARATNPDSEKVIYWVQVFAAPE